MTMEKNSLDYFVECYIKNFDETCFFANADEGLNLFEFGLFIVTPTRGGSKYGLDNPEGCFGARVDF